MYKTTRQKNPFYRQTGRPALTQAPFIVAAGEQVLAVDAKSSSAVPHAKPIAKCKWPLLVADRITNFQSNRSNIYQLSS